MASSVVGKNPTDGRHRGGVRGRHRDREAVAETFPRDGRRVVIVGRREGVLRAAADEIGGGVVPLTADLSDLLTSPGGRVVSLTSIAALRPGGGSYGAAKAGTIAWTYSLAAHLGERGITVNAVAPGYTTETKFFGDAMAEERHLRLVSETMDGRPGTRRRWPRRSPTSRRPAPRTSPRSDPGKRRRAAGPRLTPVRIAGWREPSSSPGARAGGRARWPAS